MVCFLVIFYLYGIISFSASYLVSDVKYATAVGFLNVSLVTRAKDKNPAHKWPNLHLVRLLYLFHRKNYLILSMLKQVPDKKIDAGFKHKLLAELIESYPLYKNYRDAYFQYQYKIREERGVLEGLQLYGSYGLHHSWARKLYNLGLKAYINNSVDTARIYLKHVAQMTPGWSLTQIEYALILAKTGYKKEAITVLEDCMNNRHSRAHCLEYKKIADVGNLPDPGYFKDEIFLENDNIN